MKQLFYYFILLIAFVSPHALQAQYCTPVNNGCGSGDYADSFRTTGGITNIAFLPGTCSSSFTNGYYYFTGSAGDTCTGVTGQTIHWVIYNQNSYAFQQNEIYAIWVDFNQNSTFDATEMVFQSTISAGSSDTGSFVIPVTATLGHTRLRFACFNPYSVSVIDPCTTSFALGEMADFDFVVLGCSGVPTMPNITSAPLTSPVCYDSTIQISASMPGQTYGITYQWQQAPSVTGPWTNVVGGVGATTLNYTIPPVTATIYYRLKDSCVSSGITNASPAYTVPLNAATSSILTQPLNSNICPGGNTLFYVNAIAGTGISYQWQVSNGGPYMNVTNGGPYSGATSDSLVITGATTAMNSYKYKCVLTGSCLVPATSNIATLSVSPTLISSQPATAVNTCVGGSASLGLTAIGSGLSYQWQVNSGSGYTNVSNTVGLYSGATTNTLHIISATAGLNGNQYRCNVNGLCGPVTSVTIVLSVGPPTTIIVSNGPVALCPGTSATLKASIAGTVNSYQWNLNGTPIPNAIDSYYVANVAGIYSATLSNTQNCSNTSNTLSVTYYTLAPSSISINGPLTFCQGGSVTLSATNNTPGLTYEWELNGTFISAATSSSFTANVTGAYTLVEYDGNCYSPSAPINVVSDTIPVLSVTYQGSPYFCSGDTVLLHANPGTGLIYQWQNNGNNVYGATANTYPATVSGVYSFKAMDQNGCFATSPNATLTANALPLASVSHLTPTTFCSGGSVVLNANFGSNYTYQWLLNNQTISGATNSSYTADSGGNYAVVVTNNVAYGCSATSASVTVTVNVAPAAPISANGPTTFCDGNYVALNTSAAPGQTQQWLLNGASIQGASNPYYNADSTGNYSVINTLNNCSTVSPVLSVTATPIPFDSIIFYGPPILCTGATMLLQAIIASGQTYQWSLNGINIPGANSFTYSVTTPGEYSVEVTSAGCTSYSQPVNIASANTPIPVANININSSGAVLSVSAVYVTYQWYLNNVLIPGAVSSNYSPVQYGSYSAIVTDVNGCTGQSNDVIYNSSTGVGNINAVKDAIRIYPNPATSVLNIDAPVAVNISIVSLDGRVILKNDNSKVIDISHLADGIYLVQVYDMNDNLLKVDRLVKTAQ